MEGKNIAIYLDFENLAISAETVYPSREKPLSIEPIVDYAATKGIICVKKAYGDWSREVFSQYQNRLAEQGFELVHLPATNYQGKNGADVRLAVDVMEYLQFFPAIDLILIGSGDTDFIPLIQRLRAHGKEVIITGFEHSVGALVKRNCNEFRSLEELIGKPEAGSPSSDLVVERDGDYSRKLLLRYIRNRDDESPVLMSSLKQQLLRLDPSFSERELGFASFKQFVRSFEGDVVERIEQEESTLPLVYLQDQPDTGAGRNASPEDHAAQFLAKKLRYISEPARRTEMAAALLKGMQQQEAASMNQMVEFIYEHTPQRPTKADIKKYINTLYTGMAFRPQEKKVSGPLLSRPFRLDEAVSTPEALDLLYIRRISEILQSRYPELQPQEILDLLV